MSSWRSGVTAYQPLLKQIHVHLNGRQHPSFQSTLLRMATARYTSKMKLTAPAIPRAQLKIALRGSWQLSIATMHARSTSKREKAQSGRTNLEHSRFHDSLLSLRATKVARFPSASENMTCRLRNWLLIGMRPARSSTSLSDCAQIYM